MAQPQTIISAFPPASAGPAPRNDLRNARRVQQRFLPHRGPRLASIECAACSLPAYDVGGDFYDFLEPEAGRVGIALGDIAGKGVAAALMMASLQATLRSHYALGVADLGQRLASVNRLFYECTGAEHYASLFLGEYDDATGRLRYANCGHVPPALLPAAGPIRRLPPTATVLGLFEEWTSGLAEVTLAPGDALALFSDGAPDARSRAGDEFGEERLIELLRAHRRAPLPALVRTVVAEIRRFADGQLTDDLTLVVVRARTRRSLDERPAWVGRG